MIQTKKILLFITLALIGYANMQAMDFTLKLNQVGNHKRMPVYLSTHVLMRQLNEQMRAMNSPKISPYHFVKESGNSCSWFPKETQEIKHSRQQAMQQQTANKNTRVTVKLECCSTEQAHRVLQKLPGCMIDEIIIKQTVAKKTAALIVRKEQLREEEQKKIMEPQETKQPALTENKTTNIPLPKHAPIEIEPKNLIELEVTAKCSCVIM
ncbi:MAG: hypothetical protein NTX86_02140 [Candidatus Dependentiae bacterium]|nr:hypothetical protein [Candidatus Dependentiae bacterium]